jgi:GTPase SAR1 family protein
MRLLLLGTGDAGKSTFSKQMKVIHKSGFTKAELEKYVEILRDNCLYGMNKLLFTCNEWNIEIPKKFKPQADLVMNSTELTEEVAIAIQELWECDFILKVFERNNEIQLPGGSSGTAYYIKHAQRFAKKDYVPTQDDVIRAKLRTTGISEITFMVENIEFTMVDVGGQRSERRKWLNCFVDISAVLFLVAINEYDMVLEEDYKTNRMEESLKLFTKITGAQWFENTSFILFLNKSDLFEEKIRKAPLKDHFEDYEAFVNEFTKGRKDEVNEVEKGCAYIQSQFVEAFNGTRLYPFVTCAIDTENCDRVFAAVKDTIISQALAKAGL